MPNQHPSRTLPPSFVPPSILTYVFSPHSRRPLRLGFFPKAASYGVIPTTALVVVLLSNHTTCRPASAHKFFGNPQFSVAVAGLAASQLTQLQLELAKTQILEQ